MDQINNMWEYLHLSTKHSSFLFSHVIHGNHQFFHFQILLSVILLFFPFFCGGTFDLRDLSISFHGVILLFFHFFCGGTFDLRDLSSSSHRFYLFYQFCFIFFCLQFLLIPFFSCSLFLLPSGFYFLYF